MKAVVTKGLNIFENPLQVKPLVVRTEKTGKYSTLSIADEQSDVMLQVVVDKNVKEILKEILK